MKKLLISFFNNPGVVELKPRIEQDIAEGRLSATLAVQELLKCLQMAEVITSSKIRYLITRGCWTPGFAWAVGKAGKASLRLKGKSSAQPD